ncbi:hypothetical protein DIPPA_28584 [Diplonema papillatum]|nr:hypothetical protein DIPPA_28584 [Diplonema papillatum]
MLRVPTRHGTSTRRKWACLLAALAFLLVRVPGILDGGSEAAGGGFDDDAEDGVPFLRGPRRTPDGTCLRTAFIQGHNARRLLTQGLADPCLGSWSSGRRTQHIRSEAEQT